MNYHVNKDGYYGEFGGAFVPELLWSNVEELRLNYIEMMNEASFVEEFNQLLKDYVGRPTPLYFAKRTSEKVGCKVFFKREDLCHTGAHKINNTIGQILLAQRLGKTRIIAETGAGQHGVATATVCALKGIQCIVYMGEVDIERQAPNVARMKMLGAEVRPAKSGSKTLKDATNEAIRDWINNPDDTHYIIGSVVGPHPYPDMVSRFQSVISHEIKTQLNEATGSANPTAVVACVGGGSNAAGAFYHYLDEPEVRLVSVEAAGMGVETPHSAATSQLGSFGVLHGSRTLLMQTDDGQVIEPYSVSAGLDYPGIGPQHAHLIRSGRAETVAVTDREALQAALEISRTEGIIPALESAHVFPALSRCNFKADDVVVVNLSGRGDKDLGAYRAYLDDPAGYATTPIHETHYAMGIQNLIAPFAKANNDKPLLNIYTTAGYPQKESTGELLLTLSDLGVDFIELGMPYSDPLADGETIQASSTQALRNGITLKRIFDQVKEVRDKVKPPIILMGYYNQVLRYGQQAFLDDCVKSGVDGLILPDLPLDIYENEFADDLEKRDLGISFLVTPRTPEDRIRKIDVLCRGFMYVVSSSSTTGSKAGGIDKQHAYFERLANMNLKSPRLIGFNIKDAESLQATTQFAAGGIIGSAFIRTLDAADVSGSAKTFVSNLR